MGRRGAEQRLLIAAISDGVIKEVWAFDGDRIAVRFAYEYNNDSRTACIGVR
jgi:nuclear transport factor 2 (NTF2) superfamily protein